MINVLDACIAHDVGEYSSHPARSLPDAARSADGRNMSSPSRPTQPPLSYGGGKLISETAHD